LREIDQNTPRAEVTMQLARLLPSPQDQPRWSLVSDAGYRLLAPGVTLAELLRAADLPRAVEERLDPTGACVAASTPHLLAPIDDQEVWGAGVTYERSKVARQEESESGGSFYDQVYRADRPELFFKANPRRVVGVGQPIRIRRDTAWAVPEPELTLVLTPSLRIAGFTIGNDVSARDIEGRNPLYLPQAKVHDACCALGPVITLAAALPDPRNLTIRLRIERGSEPVFTGETSTARMARRLEELADWLGRDQTFPEGVFLLTGTGIVPPDEFSLRAGDQVTIEIPGIGALTNPVVQAGA
jgi:2-dehydro-3-deoxy-D-arabinonate dehydratase